MPDGPFEEDYEDPRLGRDLRLQSPEHNPFRLPSTQDPQISPPTAFVERPRWRAPGPGDEARQTSAEGIKASYDEGDAFGVFQHTFPHVWDLAGGAAGVGIGATRSAKGRALAPWLSKMPQAPKGQVFDLSKLHELDPSIEQTTLTRYDPPRGVSQRMQDLLNNDKVWKQMRKLFDQGAMAGGERWYGTKPGRDFFMDTLGPKKGAAEWKEAMQYQAAASPQMRVQANIPAGWFYRHVARPGNAAEYSDWWEVAPGMSIGLPPLGEKGKGTTLKGSGFGAKAQGLHQRNAWDVAEGRFLTDENLLEHPKPPTFGENLNGNRELPATIDNHAISLPAMLSRDPRFLATSLTEKNEKTGEKKIWRPLEMYMNGELSMDEALKRPGFWDGKPRDNEYKALEDRYREEGRRIGMTASGTQASGWVAGAPITGVGTPTIGPTGMAAGWMDLFEPQLIATAQAHDMKPLQYLKLMAQRKKTLLPLNKQRALIDQGPFEEE